MPRQEDLLRRGPVGDAHEVGLLVVEIGEDLVDVVREHGRGVEAQVTRAGPAKQDSIADRRAALSETSGNAGQVMFEAPVPRCSMKTRSRLVFAARSGRTRLIVSTAESPGPPANQTIGSACRLRIGRWDHDDPDRDPTTTAAESVLGDRQRPASSRYAVDSAGLQHEARR